MSPQTFYPLTFARFKEARQQAHPRCVMCSPANPLGLALEFRLQADGSVEGDFNSSEMLEGYPGLLHGGVIAALLDATMTNCLFAHGCQAVTAELNVRYHHPVVLRKQVTIRAWIIRSRSPLQLVRAELQQDNCTKVSGKAKFMDLLFRDSTVSFNKLPSSTK